jgi:hypothetical protein
MDAPSLMRITPMRLQEVGRHLQKTTAKAGRQEPVMESWQ